MTRFSILVAAALLLIGCGVPVGSTGTGTPGSTPDSADAEPVGGSPDGDSLAAQLTGRSFETASAADATGFNLVPNSALTLSFYLDHEGRDAIGGDAGCNSMGGVAIWDGDTVRSDDLAQTEMACDGLMEQETWWAGLLTSGLELALDGDVLTVRAAGEAGPMQITMRDSSVLHPDLPLVGSTWRLNGLLEGDGSEGVAMSFPDGITASMTISEDPAGHLRLDVFNGLTWMSVPGGFDAATGEFSGGVVIEPADDADPLAATGGIVRVSGGLTGDSVGCPDGTTDCFVDMSLLGADFEFRTNRDTLTVTGLANYAGQGVTFIADDTAPAAEIPADDLPSE